MLARNNDHITNKHLPRNPSNPSILSIYSSIKNLSMNSLRISQAIRWKWQKGCKPAETHSKSCQGPHKDFVIDHGLVMLVIQTRLLQGSISFAPVIHQEAILYECVQNFIGKPHRSPKKFPKNLLAQFFSNRLLKISRKF